MGINPKDLPETIIRLNPDFFGVRKPAPEVPGATKDERKLHEYILADCKRRGWIALHGSMAHRTFRTEGEPDFIVFASGGRVIAAECKAAKGKLSPAQAGLIAWADKLGHTIHVVRSNDEWDAVASGKGIEP
jgi:hypothetical protein